MKKTFISIILILSTLVTSGQDKKKIACIGDSITYGAGLEDRESQCYPAVMAALLGDGYEVRNFGSNGATASDSGDYPYRNTGFLAQIREFAPDIVTVMLGTNDSKPHNWGSGKYYNGLESIIREAKSLPSSPKVIVFSPTPVSEDSKVIRDAVIRDHILADVELAATRNGCEYIDIYAPFMKERGRFLTDGIHPNAEGARKMAAFFTAACLKQSFTENVEYIPAAEQDVRDNVEQWQDLKFGMFIHWGSYSVRGVVESWAICPEDQSWSTYARKGQNYFDYVKEYEALKTVFNPVSFDPSKWAQAADYAGMKYVVFTTKHHDGFCMFDTRQTDYKITSDGCPFHTNPKANIAREVFNAFRAQGLKAGAYYSIADWNSDCYWWRAFPPKDRRINYDADRYPERWSRFCDFMNSQLDELTSGEYGDLDLIWFDLATEPSLTSHAIVPWERFAKTIRTNQPGTMMVARFTNSIYENYRTPEQYIPDHLLEYPWESCITMGEGWSYNPDERYKSTGEIITMLVKIVGRGGNLLLNVGPSPEGTLPDVVYERLHEIGDWMKVNSEGIYGTRAVLLKGNDNIFCTEKDGNRYVFYVPEDGRNELPEEIFVPELTPGTVTMLGTNGRRLKFKAVDGGTKILIPKALRDKKPCDHVWCLKIAR